ncbi:BTB/POZ domain-containing protein 1-like [Sabethes cyaneus]|uniref:BTB/POZ domain-containing protein 1-like n=1 Tax=Sabethes cyaneus TaxID=53552 RepID=UPI00237D3E1A|nr:BTB/POZ domain-containing protein 1-like [Sabethes cyaneus]
MPKEKPTDQHLPWDGIRFEDRPNHLDLVDAHLKSFKHTDVQVHIGNQVFDCHLLLLKCFSQVFDEMENVPAVVLPEEKITPEAFELIYQWLLSPSPRLQREHFVAVFVAAEFLRIPALLEHCWTCVDDSKALIEDRAFCLYTEAKYFQHTILQSMMLKRIWKYFLPLVASEGFVELPPNDVCLLLKSNHIGVFSEVDVLHSACLWLLNDWDSRCFHIGELMSLVRFPRMSPSLLSRLINCEEDERIHCILNHDSTKKLAIRALTNLWSFPKPEPVNTSRTEHRMCRGDNRCWLIDPYTAKQEDEIAGFSPHRQERSFIEFLEFLKRLIENPECWVDWAKI